MVVRDKGGEVGGDGSRVVMVMVTNGFDSLGSFVDGSGFEGFEEMALAVYLKMRIKHHWMLLLLLVVVKSQDMPHR